MMDLILVVRKVEVSWAVDVRGVNECRKEEDRREGSSDSVRRTVVFEACVSEKEGPRGVCKMRRRHRGFPEDIVTYSGEGGEGGKVRQRQKSAWESKLMCSSSISSGKS